MEAPLPALVTVVREINTPRYPSVPGRLMAEEAKVTLWNNNEMKLPLETIGLKGSATRVRRIFTPERTMGEILSDSNSPEEVARLLLDKLVEKGIINL